MAKVTATISMSLDGFVAGPNPTMKDPIGKGGELLHEWAFGAQSWRETHGLIEVRSTPVLTGLRSGGLPTRLHGESWSQSASSFSGMGRLR